MSDGIEDRLAQAIRLAESQARLDSASAVRARGDRRRRRRFALNGAVGVVAAVVIAVVVSSTLASGSPAPHASPASNPTPSASRTPSPAASPSSTPNPTASASSPAASGDDSSTPGLSTTPSQNTGATPPDPAVYVAGAWFSASQEPFGNQVTWLSSTSIGARVGGSVSEVTDPGEEAELAMPIQCAAAGIVNSAAGAQYEAFTGSSDDSPLTGSAIAANAYQGFYFYPSAAAATAAWDSIPTGWNACPALQTGMNPTTGLQQDGYAQQTLIGADDQCWSSLATEPSAGPNNGRLEHMCYVLDGDVIEWVSVRVNEVGLFSTVDFSSVDDSTVQTMQQKLAAYDG